MSMIGHYRRVTPDELTQLTAGASVIDFLYPDSDDEYDHDRELDIDKSWHAIHFLLTGSAWGGDEPLYHAVMGGEELGEEDIGYGLARYLVPELVRTVASDLEDVPEWELVERYDADRMNEEEIYPHGWGDDVAADQDYIGQHYESLVRFFREAANAGDAIVMYLA